MALKSQSPAGDGARQGISADRNAETSTGTPASTQATDGSRLDHPRYDPAALQFHLARDLPVDVHGTELRRVAREVEEALDFLAALPDGEAFGSDLVFVTTALLGVQEFLQDLAAKFDAAAGGAP
jgi:hypothetical protein